ncbi:MAG TPA: hypothetical protein VN608_04470, partial [Clostridia bacterium]|nr:hypothetical protein [Clostridia bacterium]
MSRKLWGEIALTATITATLLWAGCASSQYLTAEPLSTTPVTTPISASTPSLAPTPSAEPTPSPTPEPTPTPAPTPAYAHTYVLESPEDALNEEKVALILAELRGHYLNTTYTWGELTANEA